MNHDAVAIALVRELFGREADGFDDEYIRSKSDTYRTIRRVLDREASGITYESPE